MKKCRLFIVICFVFSCMTFLIPRPTVINADNESLNEELDKTIEKRNKERRTEKIDKFRMSKNGEGVDAWLLGIILDKVLEDITLEDLLSGATFTLREYWAGVYSEDNNHIGVIHEILRISSQEEKPIFVVESSFEYDAPDGHGSQTINVASNADFTIFESKHDFQFQGPDGTIQEQGACLGISSSEIECTFIESGNEIKKTLSSPNGSLIVNALIPMVLLSEPDDLIKESYYSIDWFEHTLHQLKFSIIENDSMMPKNGRVIHVSMEYDNHVFNADYYISAENELLRKRTIINYFDNDKAPEVRIFIYGSEKEAHDKRYIQELEEAVEDSQER